METLNKEGFSVCGIDQQGCGFSEGLECYVDRFDHYVDDVLQFARRAVPCLCFCFENTHLHDVQSLHGPSSPMSLTMCRSLPACDIPGFSGVPVFIGGCSLGGCIAVNAIVREPGLFKGAALFAPMLSLERASQHGLNYYLRFDHFPLAT